MLKLHMKTKVLFLIRQLPNSLKKGLPFHKKNKSYLGCLLGKMSEYNEVTFSLTALY